MPDRSLTVEQVLTILTETPPRIAALTTDLTPTQLHTSPNPDEWSANDVPVPPPVAVFSITYGRSHVR